LVDEVTPHGGVTLLAYLQEKRINVSACIRVN